MWDRTCYSRSIMVVRRCEPEGRGCRGAGSQPPVPLEPDSGRAGSQAACLFQHRERMGERETFPTSGALAAASADGKHGSKRASASTLIQTNEEAMSEGVERATELAMPEEQV